VSLGFLMISTQRKVVIVEAMRMDMFLRMKCFERAGKKTKVLMSPLTFRELRAKTLSVHSWGVSSQGLMKRI